MSAYYYRRQSRFRFWLLLFLLLLALPVVYVGSLGPVVYMQERGVIPKPYPPEMAKFYEPVEWLYSHDSLKGPIEYYLQFWSDFEPERFKVQKSSPPEKENEKSSEPSQTKPE